MKHARLLGEGVYKDTYWVGYKGKVIQLAPNGLRPLVKHVRLLGEGAYKDTYRVGYKPLGKKVPSHGRDRGEISDEITDIFPRKNPRLWQVSTEPRCHASTDLGRDRGEVSGEIRDRVRGRDYGTSPRNRGWNRGRDLGVGEIIWQVSNLNDRFHTAEISVIPTDFTTIEISDFTTVEISDLTPDRRRDEWSDTQDMIWYFNSLSHVRFSE